MKNVFRIAWEAVRTLPGRWKYRKRVRIASVEELPEVLNVRRLYVIGAEKPWSAALLCPCGCGETIHMSLLRNDSPSWTLRIEKSGNLPTLSPSVWRTKGCRSHFFLRHGTIVWCGTERTSVKN